MKKVYLLIFIFILFFPLMIQAQDSIETNEMIEKFTINEKGEYIDGDKSMPGHYEPVPGIHFCERDDVAGTIRSSYLILQIIRISVPIILILSIMIKLINALTNPEKMSNIKKAIISNIIAAVLIFLIPNFVSIIVNISSKNIDFSECIEKSKHPKKTLVWVEDPVTEVTQNGVYIILTSQKVSGYYFSNSKVNLTSNDSRWIPSTKDKIDFILLPGKHYIYIRINNKVIEKEIDVSTSDIIVTNDVKDIKFLETDIDSFLKNNNSSLSELNDAIARSVYIAGTQSKEGAAAGALALTQILYNKYKIKIPYGNTHGTHLTMGVPKTWGSDNITSKEKKQKMYHQGTHCGGFVAWAYTQANFEMKSTIGSSAQFCGWRYADIYGIDSSHHGEVGDIVTPGLHCDSASHVGIISAMDNKGYYITESNAVTKTIDGAVTVLENIGMVTSYVPYGKRFRSYLDTSLTIKLRKKENPVDTGF